VERVLLEEVRLAQVAGDLQGELLVVVGEGVLPDELDDLLQLSLLVEHVDRPLALLRPVVGDFVLEPRVELILVQREYDSFQLIDGKWRRSARSASSAQNVFTMRSVFWVTGSEKSPPGGDTAPIAETDPSVPLMFSK